MPEGPRSASPPIHTLDLISASLGLQRFEDRAAVCTGRVTAGGDQAGQRGAKLGQVFDLGINFFNLFPG